MIAFAREPVVSARIKLSKNVDAARILPLHFTTLSIAILAIGVVANPVNAQSFQSVAPSSVTPRDIAPPPQQRPKEVLRRGEDAVPALPTNPNFAVNVGDARIDGAFPNMAAANAAFIAGVGHQHMTLAQLYGAASKLEQAYARRGYILARVIVPPQRLAPGAPVKVAVIDGSIEGVDLSHLAAPIRSAVRARLLPLVGRHHITQAEIERALLLAGDMAGARLRSAITPGTTTGGVMLIVEGDFVRIAGQVGADNSLPATLGEWQFTGNLALNGPLGLGDQAYLTVGSQADVGRYGFPKATLGMIGAGYVLPIDNNGTTLTAEFLNSRTQPLPAPGVPQSVGNYSRGFARLSIAAIRTRQQTLNVTNAYEVITQSEKLIQFGTQTSRDHYLVWRMGANWQRDFGNVPASVSMVLSHGLAGRNGSKTIPTSRVGASADFATFEGTGEVTLPGPSGFALDITARGKTGFGKPLFLSEQFALDAANGVSAFPNGSFNVDTGTSLRGELRYPPLTLGRRMTIAPYLFGAGGWGWVARPTAVEQHGTGYYTAESAGLGGRIGVNGIPFLKGTGATISFEFGHDFSNVAGRSGGQRATLSAGFHF